MIKSLIEITYSDTKLYLGGQPWEEGGGLNKVLKDCKLGKSIILAEPIQLRHVELLPSPLLLSLFDYLTYFDSLLFIKSP